MDERFEYKQKSLFRMVEVFDPGLKLCSQILSVEHLLKTPGKQDTVGALVYMLRSIYRKNGYIDYVDLLDEDVLCLFVDQQKCGCVGLVNGFVFGGGVSLSVSYLSINQNGTIEAKLDKIITNRDYKLSWQLMDRHTIEG